MCYNSKLFQTYIISTPAPNFKKIRDGLVNFVLKLCWFDLEWPYWVWPNIWNESFIVNICKDVWILCICRSYSCILEEVYCITDLIIKIFFCAFAISSVFTKCVYIQIYRLFLFLIFSCMHKNINFKKSILFLSTMNIIVFTYKWNINPSWLSMIDGFQNVFGFECTELILLLGVHNMGSTISIVAIWNVEFKINMPT